MVNNNEDIIGFLGVVQCMLTMCDYRSIGDKKLKFN